MKVIFKHFAVSADDENRRLERIARKFLAHLSLSFIHKNIRNGFIRVNGHKKAVSYRVQKGDKLDICENLLTELHQRQKIEANAPDFALLGGTVLPQSLFTDIFVNEHIRIVSKAYGVPVHGGKDRTPSVEKLIRLQYMQAKQKKDGIQPLSFVPGPLHRLDRRSTGLLAFSQSLAGAQWFSKALADKRIVKIYTALLQGTLNTECVWEHRIEKKQTQRGGTSFNTVEVLKDVHGKIACTSVQPLAWGCIGKKKFTLARFVIQTGRTHQIRAQSAFCGFPLLGDTAYGADFFAYPDSEGQYLFLHAHTLILEKDNQPRLPERISAPLPLFFKQFNEKYLPAFEFSTYT